MIPLVGAVACAIVGWSAWRRRRSTPAATALTFTMLGLVEWGVATAVGISFTDLRLQTAFGLAIYPGVTLVVFSAFWLCRAVVDRDSRFSRRAKVLFAIEPVAMTVASATNGWHHLVFSTTRLVGHPSLLVPQVGVVFWLHSAYSYVLLTIMMYRLVRARRTATGLHRRQITSVLLGCGFPITANVVTLAMYTGGGSVDLAVVGFAGSGLTFWWALFRQGMLQLVPVARSVVFERVSDALIVLDREDRVLDLNPAASRLLRQIGPRLPENLVGERSHLLVPGQGPGYRIKDGEYVVQAGARQIDLDVRSSELTDRSGASIGRVVVVRDTTELNDKKRELTAANARLQDQLRTIDRLRADLAEQAIRDDLTGLHNRRHLIRTMEAELARAGQTGGPLGVVLLDIDHFKSVNDRFGHAVGDEMLVAIAKVLASAARQGDTVARYGGEEFVVLLPGATPDQAWNRAQEWRRLCASTFVPTGQDRLRVTFSAGVACFPESGTSAAQLLHAADKALYRAKAEGRDRVLLADSLAA
nr:diguanylate cyclase [Planosporangium thailandense]